MLTIVSSVRHPFTQGAREQQRRKSLANGKQIHLMSLESTARVNARPPQLRELATRKIKSCNIQSLFECIQQRTVYNHPHSGIPSFVVRLQFTTCGALPFCAAFALHKPFTVSIAQRLQAVRFSSQNPAAKVDRRLWQNPYKLQPFGHHR